LPLKYRLSIFAVWSVAVVIYFFTKCPIVVMGDWTHDDLMNCYRAFETPYPVIFSDLVTFWKPTNLFRPLGELWYKVIFERVGMAAEPWRWIVAVNLLFNAFLLGHLGARLSGSLSFGLAATAVASFHSMWAHLYLNTGTIFEILAYTFVYGTVAFWVEFREKKWCLPATLVLFVLGLNCKESAIVAAVYLFFYEVIWHRKIPWKLCVPLGLISVAFIVGRVNGPGGISSIGQYKPVYTLGTYLERYRGYMAPLVMWKNAPLWGCLLLGLVPLVQRNKMGLFTAAIFPFGILPLAFVPDRGLEGVAIACGALAFTLAGFLLWLPKETWRLGGAVALWVMVGMWMPGLKTIDGWNTEYAEIRTFHESLLKVAPNLPPRVQIRFENEPFRDGNTWASWFVTRLAYRDLTIDVAGATNPHTKDWPRTKDFMVFDWRDGAIVRVR
jgi:hypothetical protein